MRRSSSGCSQRGWLWRTRVTSMWRRGSSATQGGEKEQSKVPTNSQYFYLLQTHHPFIASCYMKNSTTQILQTIVLHQQESRYCRLVPFLCYRWRLSITCSICKWHPHIDSCHLCLQKGKHNPWQESLHRTVWSNNYLHHPFLLWPWMGHLPYVNTCPFLVSHWKLYLV